MSCIVAHPANAPPGEAVACHECIEARDVRLAHYETISTTREAELEALRALYTYASEGIPVATWTSTTETNECFCCGMSVTEPCRAHCWVDALREKLGAVDAARKGTTT